MGFTKFSHSLLIIREELVNIYCLTFYLNVKFINSCGFCLIFTIKFGNYYFGQKLFVGIYGARIMLLHFPLIFYNCRFTKDDILKWLSNVSLLLY
jgi:hypothetical protein